MDKKDLSLKSKIGCIVVAGIVATTLNFGIYSIGTSLSQNLAKNLQEQEERLQEEYMLSMSLVVRI